MPPKVSAEMKEAIRLVRSGVTGTEAAKRAGIRVETLYRSPEYKQAKAALGRAPAPPMVLSVSSVAEAKAAIGQLESYILQERAYTDDFEDIAVLNLTVSTSNKLRAGGFDTISALVGIVDMTSNELWDRYSIGRKSYNEIVNALQVFRDRER